MQISHKRRADIARAGFTLVEVMTAMMVAALVAGAVLLMAPGQGSALRASAERLAARIKVAEDRAVLTNRTLALVVTPEGYGFERLEDAGWQRIEGETSGLSFHIWPRNARPRLAELDGGDLSSGRARATRFDPVGGAAPMRLVIDGDGDDWLVEIDDAGAVRVEQSR
jgi:general secretion pathway protein H